MRYEFESAERNRTSTGDQGGWLHSCVHHAFTLFDSHSGSVTVVGPDFPVLEIDAVFQQSSRKVAPLLREGGHALDVQFQQCAERLVRSRRNAECSTYARSTTSSLDQMSIM